MAKEPTVRENTDVSTVAASTISRRSLFRDSALTAGALALASRIDVSYALAQDEGPIKIGWLGDRTGDFSVVGVQKFNAANLAVKELNDVGGLLGREVVLVAEDAQSDNRRYQEMARKLILQDKVDVLHACFTSASREAIRPIVDQNKMLFFYNNQYEGGVCDSWVFPTGCVPDHQVVPFMPAVMEKFGPRVYTIAADYNFGQLTADWCRKIVEQQGGEIIGEEFIPLDVSQFSTSITNIQNAKPDVLIVLLVGIKQSSFYEQKNSAGLQVPMATTINMGQGYEHLRFAPPALNNMYVTVNFMQELAEHLDTDFPDRIRALYPDAEYVGMEAAAEYEGINLYATAATAAGTTDKDTVRQALEQNVSFEGPGGTVTIDPATHHTIRNIYMVHADEEHNIILDDTFEAVRPDWLSLEKGCNLPEKPDNTQYEP
jgi:urea transport system substrate-binding protein